jgi:hypothetical protein
MEYMALKNIYFYILNIYALNYRISQEIQLFSDLKFD